MENRLRLLPHSPTTVFSILVTITLLLSSCFDKERTLEWSVHNCFQQDVELSIYLRDEGIAKKVKSPFLIESGDSVLIITIIKFRGGSMSFTQFVDSAKVRTIADDTWIAIWRRGKEPYFAEGYEIMQDFFDWNGGDTPMHYMLIYSEEHVKFRFYLSSEVQ